MAAYVKFQLEDGTLVYIESADSPKSSSGLLPPGKSGDHGAEQAALNFDQSISSVRKMAAELVSQMTSGFAESPEELSVNFGLKASGEVGSLVVARGGMEANFNVMLRWHKNRDKDEDKDAENKASAAETSATNAVAKKARKEDKSEAEAEEIAEE